MHFAITIDTEVDKSGDWSVSDPATYYGIHQGVGEILQPLFDAFGIPPVYFLSNEILARADLSSVFVPYHDAGRAELATHLHYDAAGPFGIGKIAGQRLDKVQALLSEEDERQALGWLTDRFIDRFDHRPASFRAGRYGLGPNSIAILAELGYRVDSSVTPGLVWRYAFGNRQVTCDYRAAPHVPYQCAGNDAAAEGHSGILEVPISTTKVPPGLGEIARLAAGRPRRMIWARPAFASRREMARMIRAAAGTGNHTNILVMMFHNMEVIAGKSPYAATPAEAESHVGDIRYFIETALAAGLTPITLKDYADRFGGQVMGGRDIP